MQNHAATLFCRSSGAPFFQALRCLSDSMQTVWTDQMNSWRADVRLENHESMRVATLHIDILADFNWFFHWNCLKFWGKTLGIHASEPRKN